MEERTQEAQRVFMLNCDVMQRIQADEYHFDTRELKDKNMFEDQLDHWTLWEAGYYAATHQLDDEETSFTDI